MKNATGCAVILCLLLVPAISRADDGHIAVIRQISGHVTVVRDAMEIPAALGMNLMRSDKLVSAADGSAGMIFEDGTLLTLGKSSEVNLTRYSFSPADSNYAFSAYLKRGTAIYSSGKIGKIAPQSVSVETPKAVIGVRGTRFLVSVD